MTKGQHNWLTVQTFNTPLQPVFMTVNKNDVVVESYDLNPQDKESVEA